MSRRRCSASVAEPTQPEPLTVTGNQAQGLQTYMEQASRRGGLLQRERRVRGQQQGPQRLPDLPGRPEGAGQVGVRAGAAGEPVHLLRGLRECGRAGVAAAAAFTFEDGSMKEVMIPAEIWRVNNEKVTKHVRRDEEDRVGRSWMRGTRSRMRCVEQRLPAARGPSRLDVFRSTQTAARNQMADALVELKAKEAAGKPGCAARRRATEEPR